jgi:lysozyme
MGNVIGSAVASAILLLTPVPENKPCNDNCRMSDEGVQLVRTFEGFSPFVYKDVAGKPTIGFGHLILPGEKFKEPMTGPEAEALLRADFKPVEREVNRSVVISLRQSQFDALGSFSFNLGVGSLRSSTLLRYVNAHRHPEVPAQFMRWVYADGKVFKGLVNRRAAEAGFYQQH